jgi:hypothetical protein
MNDPPANPFPDGGSRFYLYQQRGQIIVRWGLSRRQLRQKLAERLKRNQQIQGLDSVVVPVPSFRSFCWSEKRSFYDGVVHLPTRELELKAFAGRTFRKAPEGSTVACQPPREAS